MSPTTRLLAWSLAWLLLAVVAVAVPALIQPWWWLGLGVLVVVAVDALLAGCGGRSRFRGGCRGGSPWGKSAR